MLSHDFEVLQGSIIGRDLIEPNSYYRWKGDMKTEVGSKDKELGMVLLRLLLTVAISRLKNQ